MMPSASRLGLHPLSRTAPLDGDIRTGVETCAGTFEIRAGSAGTWLRAPGLAQAASSAPWMHRSEPIRAFIPGHAKQARFPAQNPGKARSAGNFTSTYVVWSPSSRRTGKINCRKAANLIDVEHAEPPLECARYCQARADDALRHRFVRRRIHRAPESDVDPRCGGDRPRRLIASVSNRLRREEAL